jgi:hypothetical protein
MKTPLLVGLLLLSPAALVGQSRAVSFHLDPAQFRLQVLATDVVVLSGVLDAAGPGLLDDVTLHVGASVTSRVLKEFEVAAARNEVALARIASDSSLPPEAMLLVVGLPTATSSVHQRVFQFLARMVNEVQVAVAPDTRSKTIWGIQQALTSAGFKGVRVMLDSIQARRIGTATFP